MALKFLQIAARDIIRDLGSVWVSSLITRAILYAVVAILVLGAAGFLFAAGYIALASAVGPIFANLIVAGVLIVLAGAVLLVIRSIARRAARRRKLAMAQAVAALAVMKNAAGSAASDHGGTIAIAALLLGLLAGRSVFSGGGGDDADQDK